MEKIKEDMDSRSLAVKQRSSLAMQLLDLGCLEEKSEMFLKSLKKF